MRNQSMLSAGNRAIVDRIGQLILSKGSASVCDFPEAAADPIRVLQSLDVIERRGDELHIVRD